MKDYTFKPKLYHSKRNSNSALSPVEAVERLYGNAQVRESKMEQRKKEIEME